MSKKGKGYIKKLREKIGHDKFIHPAARIIIENKYGQILFIERKDNGNLGIPAGGIEEGETIEECMKREVREETGLEILKLEVIGISSNPQSETVIYPNGDVIQYFTIEFYSNSWTGNLKVEDEEEIVNIKFMDRTYLDNLPDNEKSIIESLEYFKKEKKIRLN